MWIHPLWEVAESTFYLHWLDRVFAVKLASPMQKYWWLFREWSNYKFLWPSSSSNCQQPLIKKVGLPGFPISTGGSQMVANQSLGLCDWGLINFYRLLYIFLYRVMLAGYPCSPTFSNEYPLNCFFFPLVSSPSMTRGFTVFLYWSFSWTPTFGIRQQSSNTISVWQAQSSKIRIHFESDS